MRLGKLSASLSAFGAARRPTVVIVAMLLAAAINCLQFFKIDASLRASQRALQPFDTFDFTKIAMRSDHIRLSHNLFALIGQQAPGARLIVTTPDLNGHRWFRSRMLALGLLERMDVCEVDPAHIGFADPTVDLLATGTIANRGKNAKKPPLIWGVAKLSPEPKTLVQVKTTEFDVLVLDADLYKLNLKDCK